MLVEWLADERRIAEQLDNSAYLNKEFASQARRALFPNSDRSCKLATSCRVKARRHLFSEASRVRNTSSAGIVSTVPSSIS